MPVVISGLSLSVSALTWWRAGVWRREDREEAQRRHAEEHEAGRRRAAEERELKRPLVELRRVSVRREGGGLDRVAVTLAVLNRGDAPARYLEFGVRWRGHEVQAGPRGEPQQAHALAKGEELTWTAHLPPRVEAEMRAEQLDVYQELEDWARYRDPWGTIHELPRRIVGAPGDVDPPRTGPDSVA